MDLYTEWARAICYNRCTPQPSRRYSAGLISIRPDRDGKVLGYQGLDEVQRSIGQWIGEIHMPAVGQKLPDVGAGYMGLGWMHIRHPDYDECRKLLDYVARTVKIKAG